jgi:hypothetical protein
MAEARALNVAAPSPPADRHGSSYAGSVLRRLSKNRTAVWGIYAVLGLLSLATLAPLLALNQPFYWNARSGPEFPWLSALFNRLLFENAVDLFFNLLLVTAPFIWIAAHVLRRRNPALGRARAYAR